MRSPLRTAAKVGLCLWLVLLSVSYYLVDPSPASSACSDVSPRCIDLLERCAADEYRALLRLACPVTCGACAAPLPTTADFECRDTRAECEHIAAADRCDTRPLTFWRDCRSLVAFRAPACCSTQQLAPPPPTRRRAVRA